jgi:hypothetical protein
MAKWLTSLALIVALGGGVLAGMPLHSEGQECAMSGMGSHMDCCAKAHKQAATPEVTAARLCCAFNCPSSGTTPPSSSVQRVSPLSVIAQHPAAVQSPLVIPTLRPRLDAAQDHLQNSQPTYIRHLALLI